MAPDRLATVPVVDSLPVSFYPSTRLQLVDTTVDGTTCLAWSKGATDHAAEITVLSGQGLPIPVAEDRQLLHLVKDAGDPAAVEADQVFIGADATNLVMTTSAARPPTAANRCGGSPIKGCATAIELDEESRSGAGGVTGLGAAGAVAADPGVRARSGAEPRRRADPA